MALRFVSGTLIECSRAYLDPLAQVGAYFDLEGITDDKSFGGLEVLQLLDGRTYVSSAKVEPLQILLAAESRQRRISFFEAADRLRRGRRHRLRWEGTRVSDAIVGVSTSKAAAASSREWIEGRRALALVEQAIDVYGLDIAERVLGCACGGAESEDENVSKANIGASSASYGAFLAVLQALAWDVLPIRLAKVSMRAKRDLKGKIVVRRLLGSLELYERRIPAEDENRLDLEDRLGEEKQKREADEERARQEEEIRQRILEEEKAAKEKMEALAVLEEQAAAAREELDLWQTKKEKMEWERWQREEDFRRRETELEEKIATGNSRVDEYRTLREKENEEAEMREQLIMEKLEEISMLRAQEEQLRTDLTNGEDTRSNLYAMLAETERSRFCRPRSVSRSSALPRAMPDR